MAFIPSKARQKVRKVAVDYDGETFNIWYRPAAVTPKAFDALSTDEGAENMDRLSRMVIDFIGDWEIGEIATDEHDNPVHDEDGNPKLDKWPIDKEHVTTLPIAVLNAMIRAVGDDMKPGEATAGGSLVG